MPSVTHAFSLILTFGCPVSHTSDTFIYFFPDYPSNMRLILEGKKD